MLIRFLYIEDEQGGLGKEGGMGVQIMTDEFWGGRGDGGTIHPKTHHDDNDD